MDEADLGNESAMDIQDKAIAAVRGRVKPILLEYECRECGDPTTGARWCGVSCCRSWEINQKRGLR